MNIALLLDSKPNKYELALISAFVQSFKSRRKDSLFFSILRTPILKGPANRMKRPPTVIRRKKEETASL